MKQELDAMEAQRVISKVQQPTPWCTGMVVVKKKNRVRICIYLKPVNQCVLRKHHPLLKVDDILGQLTGATVFSKLDANRGFWQVPLTENPGCLSLSLSRSEGTATINFPLAF